ncbi:protein of unknown function (plasmid) [Agrobacterium pusense]|uniref:Uncharacterized protein n=1 Tax=Agrobacterium pusense TaxID=648995 RepID=U4QHP1_9HYPH|nr:protein of unknown function [Agrobacterium pusense]
MVSVQERRRSQGILLELTVVHSQRRLCAFEAVVVRYPRIKLLCPFIPDVSIAITRSLKQSFRLSGLQRC